MSSDIYEALNLPFLIYKHFGMTHLSISKDNKGQKQLVSRKVDVAVNIVTVAAIIAWIFVYWRSCILYSVNHGPLLRLNLYTSMALNTAGIVAILASGLTRRQQMLKIFHQMSRFDRKLHRTTQLPTQYRSKRSSLILLGRSLQLLLYAIAVSISLSYFDFPVSSVLTYGVILVMVSSSSTFHCSFILECLRRAEFVNEYMEKLLFGNRTVACIEAKLTPVVDVCYRLENLRTEMCLLIDTVQDINKYFEVQLLVKTSHLFGNCLWTAYYTISDYGERSDLFSVLKTNLLTLLWCLSCLADFCTDIYFYQSLLKEVSLMLHTH